MKEAAARMSRSRRTFLKAAVAAGGAGTLTAVSASPADSIDRIRKTDSPPVKPDDGATGYHETAHIKDYYKTLRE